MARFFGKVGFVFQEETSPGVYIDNDPVEKSYYGDVLRNIQRTQGSGQVNDDLNFSNEISIIADPFAFEHAYSMQYIEFMGAKWKITSIEVRFPRLILTVGGVYNG